MTKLRHGLTLEACIVIQHIEDVSAEQGLDLVEQLNHFTNSRSEGDLNDFALAVGLTVEQCQQVQLEIDN